MPPSAQANPQGKDLVRWKYQRYMHDYLGCIKAVDERVGRTAEVPRRRGPGRRTRSSSTASDQGFYLGEHGWFDKRWIFEESLRTPLLVRWPGVVEAGERRATWSRNIDFAETFLDAAGLPSPPRCRAAASCRCSRARRPPDWRKSFYYHYYEYPRPAPVRPHYGVVTDRYKLVRFDEPDVDYWELFDNKTDPKELTSVYGKPDYADRQKELEFELARLRKELKVPDPDPAASTIRQAAEKAKIKGKSTP